MSRSKILVTALLLSLCFSTVAQKKVLLQLDLEIGDTYQMITEMQNEVNQTVMGMEQKITQVVTQYMTYTVLGVNSDGNMRMKLTFDRVIYNANQPGMESSYDSETDDSPSTPQAIGYAAMLNVPFELEMKKTGEVVKFMGFDKAIDNILEQQNITDPEQQKSVRAALAETINDETLVDQLSLSTTFPEKEVGIGDSWVKEAEVNSGNFPLQTTTTYTVQEIKKDEIVLAVASQLSTTEDGGSMETNGMTMIAELAGDQSGTVVVERNTGWIKSSKISQDIDGTMTVLPSPQMPDGMSWPMKITTNIITRSKN